MQKRLIFLLLSGIIIFSAKLNAQDKNCTARFDSLQFEFKIALTRLDSLATAQAKLQAENDQLSTELKQTMNDLTEMIKNKLYCANGLVQAKKLIADQMAMITKLEADIKRLSESKKQ